MSDNDYPPLPAAVLNVPKTPDTPKPWKCIPSEEFAASLKTFQAGIASLITALEANKDHKKLGVILKINFPEQLSISTDTTQTSFKLSCYCNGGE